MLNGFSADDAKAFAASPAGRQLIEMLKKSRSEDLNKAQRYAAAGNMKQAAEALQGLIRDPQVQKLLQEFGG